MSNTEESNMMREVCCFTEQFDDYYQICFRLRVNGKMDKTKGKKEEIMD